MNSVLGQKAESVSTAESKAEVELTVDAESDATEKTDGEAEIDSIASAFVDSDESLNAQEEEQNKFKVSGKSGYPYVD